jgi:hypothetical protein
MMNPNLIAACGMNCNLCVAHLRDKRKCPGCRGSDADKSISCIRCFIRNCEILHGNDWRHCSEKCAEFPCDRLRRLDKRYRTKYGMSMIENLKTLGDKGVREFIRLQKKRWVKRGRIFCVHKKTYYPLV